jgi:hypothetical protein
MNMSNGNSVDLKTEIIVIPDLVPKSLQDQIEDEMTSLRFPWYYKHSVSGYPNNPEVFKYIINLLANLLQHPQNKANTALTIKSVEGSGKDTIFNWFGNNILGKDYYFNDDFKLSRKTLNKSK